MVPSFVGRVKAYLGGVRYTTVFGNPAEYIRTLNKEQEVWVRNTAGTQVIPRGFKIPEM